MQDKGWYILVVEEAQQADFTQQALDVLRVLERVRNLLQRDLKHAQPAITELVRDRLSAIKSRQAAGRPSRRAWHLYRMRRLRTIPARRQHPFHVVKGSSQTSHRPAVHALSEVVACLSKLPNKLVPLVDLEGHAERSEGHHGGGVPESNRHGRVASCHTSAFAEARANGVETSYLLLSGGFQIPSPWRSPGASRCPKQIGKTLRAQRLQACARDRE